MPAPARLPPRWLHLRAESNKTLEELVGDPRQRPADSRRLPNLRKPCLRETLRGAGPKAPPPESPSSASRENAERDESTPGWRADELDGVVSSSPILGAEPEKKKKKNRSKRAARSGWRSRRRRSSPRQRGWPRASLLPARHRSARLMHLVSGAAAEDALAGPVRTVRRGPSVLSKYLGR